MPIRVEPGPFCEMDLAHKAIIIVIFIRISIKKVLQQLSCTPFCLRKPLFFLLLSSICVILNVLGEGSSDILDAK